MRLPGTKIGRGGEDPSPPAPDKLAPRRIAAARACRAWRELDPADLVTREHGYFVDPENDVAYRRYAGDALSPSAEVVADMTALAFFVQDGDVMILEQCPSSWTEITYQRARAGAR